ncbi:MAG TPA: hypothetical protein EYP94_00200, partial [Gammaproteobacteria bacterium]|nr:hypothetical protein [Gammaproteobacteria bacterium]
MAKSCKDLFEKAMKKAGRLEAQVEALELDLGPTALRTQGGLDKESINEMLGYQRRNTVRAGVTTWLNKKQNRNATKVGGYKYSFTKLTHMEGGKRGVQKDLHAQASRLLDGPLKGVREGRALDQGHFVGSSAGAVGKVKYGRAVLGTQGLSEVSAENIAYGVVGRIAQAKETIGMEAAGPGASEHYDAKKAIKPLEKQVGDLLEGMVAIEFVKDMVDQIMANLADGKPLMQATLEISKDNRAFGNVEKVLGQEIVKEFVRVFEENIIESTQKFMEVEGLNCTSSPSTEESIAIAIERTIMGVKAKKAKKRKVIKPKIKPKVIFKVKKTKAVIPKIAKKKGQIQAQMSPLALRGLLQRAISAAIKHNMGKGRARTVLNYRTGRFAESVNIDNVVPRRDGAMIAFYSYMKNPYSTFAEGGAQYPSKPSRDPNLL